LSEVIVKNGGGTMLEQLLPMSFAVRASARSLGFLMGYVYYRLAVNLKCFGFAHVQLCVSVCAVSIPESVTDSTT